MSDPYKILGVSPSAGDDEIKRVYRELVKKYHPDNYQDSPLADLAQEKMSEINAAYDVVVKQRKTSSQSGGQGYSGTSYQYQGSGQFNDIRQLINVGKILEAQELLEGIPQSSRDAEWHFLKGYVLYTRGFLEDALPYFQRAVQMDPQNAEYSSMLSRLMNSRQYGYTNRNYSDFGLCNPCGLCSAMMCLNCGCPVTCCCI